METIAVDTLDGLKQVIEENQKGTVIICNIPDLTAGIDIYNYIDGKGDFVDAKKKFGAYRFYAGLKILEGLNDVISAAPIETWNELIGFIKRKTGNRGSPRNAFVKQENGHTIQTFQDGGSIIVLQERGT